MAARLSELLAARPVVVMDGGMGTSVEDRGVDVRNPLWGSVVLLTEAGRALNAALHREFCDAGAQILIASTHNASLSASEAYLRACLEGAPTGELDPRLAEAVLARQPAERAEALFRFVNAEAVASARQASSGSSVAVAGAIGGAEAAYTTVSRMSPDEALARMAPQAELLASLEIDLLLFEMISTASEVAACARLVRDLARTRPGLPVGVGFPCSALGTTHGGVSMDEAACAFGDDLPQLLFIQCTRQDLVDAPLRALMERVGDPRRVGVYANDGRRWENQRWAGERISPERYAERARTWADLGASIIGGCCGTGPAHVAALSALARARAT